MWGYTGYIGINRGYVGIIGKKMETTIQVYKGSMEKSMEIAVQGCIGIMGKKVENYHLGFRYVVSGNQQILVSMLWMTWGRCVGAIYIYIFICIYIYITP